MIAGVYEFRIVMCLMFYIMISDMVCVQSCKLDGLHHITHRHLVLSCLVSLCLIIPCRVAVYHVKSYHLTSCGIS